MPQEISQEELNNMSPEQIAELQKQNCLFCKIIKGEIPSKKIYEDEFCMGILDINPASEGHVLLLPKEHYQILPQIPEKIQNRLFIVAKEISHSILRAFNVKGTNIFVANGVAAGQKAPHFMVHVFSRTENDGIFANKTLNLSPADIKTLKDHLLPKIYAAFNITPIPLGEPETEPFLDEDNIDRNLVRELNKQENEPAKKETPKKNSDRKQDKNNERQDEESQEAEEDKEEKEEIEHDEEYEESEKETEDVPADEKEIPEDQNSSKHVDDLEVPSPPDDEEPFVPLPDDDHDEDKTDLDKISKLFT